MVDLQQALARVYERDGAVAAPAPPIAHRIAALVRGGDYSLCDIADLCAADPAIAIELLATAASGRDAERVASIPRALAAVGDRGLVAIARTIAEEAEALAASPFAPLRRAGWRDALTSAVLCRELARMRGLPQDVAYACGLLHDVGGNVALSLVERLAAGGGREGAAAAPGWQRLVARWHAPLGAELAVRRRLPAAVVDAIALHHAERPDPGRSAEVVRTVRTIDAVLSLFAPDDPAPEDLRALSDLTWWEAERLGRVREALEPRVEALDVEPAARAPARAAPLHRAAAVVLRIAERDYAAVGFTARQLLVAGPAPLGEGVLVEVERVDPAGPAFHAHVLVSWEDGVRHRSVLAPVPIAGPAAPSLRPAAAA